MIANNNLTLHNFLLQNNLKNMSGKTVAIIGEQASFYNTVKHIEYSNTNNNWQNVYVAHFQN